MKFLLASLLCGSIWAQPAVFVRNAADPTLAPTPGSLVEAGIVAAVSPSDVANRIDAATVTLQLFPSDSQTPILLPVLTQKSATSVIALLPSTVPLGPAQVHFIVNGRIKVQWESL